MFICSTDMLVEYTIRNRKLEITIKRKGAELCSVLNKAGKEFMWQAGSVWPRHAPNLFPVVGSLLDHEYTLDGETFSLSHHGFARDMDFDMLHQSEHSISFVLQHTPETLCWYPFPFTLLITYTLGGNTLKQTFRVINTGDKVMHTSFGGHPAFAVSEISDYFIEFSEEENVKADILSGPYLSGERIAMIEGKSISLTKSIFDNDALIFQGLKSEKVSLVNIKTAHRITVDISEWPYLGIWAKPGAPFVCIEPWQGLADYHSHNKNIVDKKGIVTIPKGEEISRSFIMEFES